MLSLSANREGKKLFYVPSLHAFLIMSLNITSTHFVIFLETLIGRKCPLLLYLIRKNLIPVPISHLRGVPTCAIKHQRQRQESKSGFQTCLTIKLLYPTLSTFFPRFFLMKVLLYKTVTGVWFLITWKGHYTEKDECRIEC